MGTLNEGERNLVKALITLPEKLRNVPFSLSARKYLSETYSMNMLTLNRNINSLKEKGYLVEAYGELDFQEGIKQLLWIANNKEELSIQINLIKEIEDDKQAVADVDPEGNENVQPG